VPVNPIAEESSVRKCPPHVAEEATQAVPSTQVKGAKRKASREIRDYYPEYVNVKAVKSAEKKRVNGAKRCAGEFGEGMGSSRKWYSSFPYGPIFPLR
jgi:hypothetical protein